MTHGSITTRSDRFFDFAKSGTSEYIGPGSYDMPDLIKTPYESPYPFNSTAARFRGPPESTPGPSDYNPQLPRLSIHGGGAMMRSGSPRKSFDIHDGPSSADYGSHWDWRKNRPGISPSKRQQMDSKSPRAFNLAAPQYHVSSSADFDTRKPYDRKTTIPKTARYYRKEDPTPGPSDYNTLSPRSFSPNKSPSFMSNAERDVFKTPDWIVDRDGLSQTQWKTPSKGAPFGSRQRHKSFWTKNNNPSPCQYNVTKSQEFRTQHAAPFNSGSNRGNLWDGNANPGPADYNIGHSRRYRDSNNAPFFQRSERFAVKPPEYEACVAKYNIEEGELLNKARKTSSPSPPFQISSPRDPYNVKDKNPGVGTYNLSREPDHKLRHAIGVAPRSKPNTIFGDPVNDAPGPGKYYDLKSPRIPGGFIAKDGRKPLPNGPENTPGPVAYVSEFNMFKPSFNVTYSMGKF